MKLEIGSGQNPTEGYLHLDMNNESKEVDFVGDIRSLLSSDYSIEVSSQLKRIQPESFEEIKAFHIIEHIQWIYQESLLRLLYDWLINDGVLNIETPDLAWIMKSYLNNQNGSWWKFWRRQKKYCFPANEHPDLIESGNPRQFYRWVNYKIFSGCSLNDYHHCLYDKESLTRTLQYTGYANIAVKSHYGILYATAYKKEGKTQNQEYFQQ
jgi:hypothetical protein